MIAAPFQFFAEGLPYPLTLAFFYVEGIGFTIALLYFYHIFVRKGRHFHLVLFNKFETPVIDRGYNEKIVAGVMGAGQKLRAVHSGNLNTYLLWTVAGFLIVLLWFVIQLWFL
jgi:hypothetical protein